MFGKKKETPAPTVEEKKEKPTPAYLREDYPFRICKFRTMVKNADKIGGGATALNDSRITKVGALLRKTKLA